jgi:hypothetical protein
MRIFLYFQGPDNIFVFSRSLEKWSKWQSDFWYCKFKDFSLKKKKSYIW